MAAIEVTITGVLYDKLQRTVQNVVLIGEASLTGVGVGGGPMPPGQGGGGSPPGIWGGGNVPMPNPPIANVPGAPGYRPPGDHIWGGGNVPMPSPPIANVPGLPPMPDQPPEQPDAIKPPPPDGGWGWSPTYGWGYFPGTGGAGPHKT